MNEPPSLELVPLDPSEGGRAVAAPVSAAPEAIEIASVEKTRHLAPDPVPPGDRFAREAARQYAEGHIDQPLWDRAVAQAGDDREAAAAIYLKARATALRLLDRERRHRQAESAAQAAAPAPEASLPEPDVDADADADADPEPDAADRRRDWLRGRGKWVIAAAACGVLIVVAVGGWLLWPSGDDGASITASVAVAPKPKPAAPKAAADAPAKPAVAPDFMQKIQELKDAGNWNVLVLYAVEWTRRDSTNPAAWNELRAGYAQLRQYEDALGAAKKAVELTPADGRMWRNLGSAHLDVDDAAGALRAFGEAAARDEQDVEALRQVGLANVRLGRLPEARSAFDRALAASPGDAALACARGAVAQMAAAPKDAHGGVMAVREIEGRCRGVGQAAAGAAPTPAGTAPTTTGAGK